MELGFGGCLRYFLRPAYTYPCSDSGLALFCTSVRFHTVFNPVSLALGTKLLHYSCSLIMIKLREPADDEICKSHEISTLQIMTFEFQILLTDILLPRDIKCMNAFFKGGLDAQSITEDSF